MAKRKRSSSSKKPIQQDEHSDKKRLRNPPVGLVTPDTEPTKTDTKPCLCHWDEQCLRIERDVVAERPLIRPIDFRVRGVPVPGATRELRKPLRRELE